jgi:hypothetical protein
MYLANLADFFTTIIDLRNPYITEGNPEYLVLGPKLFFTIKLLAPLLVGGGFYFLCKSKELSIIYIIEMVGIGVLFSFLALHNILLSLNTLF